MSAVVRTSTLCLYDVLLMRADRVTLELVS